MKIIVLALAIAALASSAYSADESLWERWGAAPYASSLKEAGEKAPVAIDGFNMPPAVKEHFIEDSNIFRSDSFVYLIPNMPLEQMWTGGLHPHVMNKKTVAEISVSKSPDRRSYPTDSVFETAKAFSWTYVYEGETYVLYLPLVCFNWCWAFGPPPVPVPDRCVEISFNASPDSVRYVRWGIATADGQPFLSSACNAQRQGDGPWTAWIGQCDACVRTPSAMIFIRTFIGGQADILHKFVYPVTNKYQTLRFSTDIWTDVVYICLEYLDGSRTAGVYLRPEDWKDGQYEFFVQDRFWISDKD